MKILAIGDSWSSAVVAGAPGHGGWPEILGLPGVMRQAVAGSTAAQWAYNFDGRLENAVETPAEGVVMSLLGNDAIAAMSDGVATPKEILEGLDHMRKVVDKVQKKVTVVVLYADPFFGKNKGYAVMIPLLNSAIRLACPEWVDFFDTYAILKPEHFDGTDIHPTMAGHQAIADGLMGLLNLEQV